MGGSVVTLCSLPECLSSSWYWCMSGLCARDWAKSCRHFTGTYVKIRPILLKPGKSSYPLPPKKKLRACHALQRARIAPGPRPMRPDGLRVSTTWRFAQKCSYERDMFETLRKIPKHNYTYMHPLLSLEVATPQKKSIHSKLSSIASPPHRRY